MSATVSRKKWFNRLLSVTACLGLAGCFSLGTPALPESPLNWQYRSTAPISTQELQITEQTIQSLHLKVQYLGEAKPLATGYSVLGLITRYVVPYTHQTLLFQLDLENKGNQPIQVQPMHIQLETSPETDPQKPLPLEYFKQTWPTQAVRTPEMLVDQSVAIGEVIRTLFTGQVLLPGRPLRGIVAFTKPESEPQMLTLKMTHIDMAPEPQTATFTFQKP